MATVASENNVQELYIAYFGRPADPAGLAFYADALDAGTTTIEDIATSFGNSTEAASIVALSTDDYLAAVYLQAFARAYDTAVDGTFWADAINSGATTKELAMIQILDGASAGADADSVANKVTVATTYTTAVTADGKEYATADITAAKAVLSGVTSDAATVTTGNTAAQTAVDSLSVVATGISTDPVALTAGVDIVESGADNDTVTATNATLGATDIISDSATNDADTLNLTLGADATAATTITNVETINVDINYFTGDATTFDATNVTGANIVLSSSKLGYNGLAGVSAVAANTVTAGSSVTNLTVAGVTTGAINLGSATTASVTTAAAANEPTITVNGDVALTLATATTVNLVSTGDAVVTLVPGAATTIAVTGTGNVSFVGSLGGVTITGASAVEHTATTGDISGLGDVVTVSGAATALTVGDTQTVTLTADSAGLTVTGQSATTGVATISTGISLTSVTFATANAATINVTAAATLATVVTAGADLTLNAAADTTVTTLTATADAVTLTGAGDVTITSGAVTSIDASASTGDFSYTLVAGGVSQTVTGSATAANTVATANLADILGYTGGSGVDTVTAATMTTGTLAAELGGGNDIVNFGAAIAAGGVVAIDGGAGTDTVNLATGVDYSAAGTWAVNNFEALTVTDAAAAAVVNQTATVTGVQAEGFSSLAITGPATGTSDDTLALTVTATAAGTTDLSGLTVADTTAITVAINGTDGGAQTIVGTNASDTIDAGTGTATVGNTLTGGAGDNVFVFADSDSVEASMTSISDYTAAAAASDNDQITLGQTTLVADSTTDVSSLVTGETSTVNAVVVDGVVSLSGLTADKALFNTLALMVDVVELVVDGDTISGAADVPSIAFEFNGNTYLAEFTETGIATDTYTTTSVIELTGTTGITAVSGTAAADTILIA